eukprot:8667436-Pyramimonas_sp.AAC.1
MRKVSCCVSLLRARDRGAAPPSRAPVRPSQMGASSAGVSRVVCHRCPGELFARVTGASVAAVLLAGGSAGFLDSQIAGTRVAPDGR